jgi:hypothetical protein
MLALGDIGMSVKKLVKNTYDIRAAYRFCIATEVK